MGLGLGVALVVGVGSAVAASALSSMVRHHAAAAKHAIAMRRLIPRIKTWHSYLRRSCTLLDEGLSSA